MKNFLSSFFGLDEPEPDPVEAPPTPVELLMCAVRHGEDYKPALATYLRALADLSGLVVGCAPEEVESGRAAVTIAKSAVTIDKEEGSYTYECDRPQSRVILLSAEPGLSDCYMLTLIVPLLQKAYDDHNKKRLADLARQREELDAMKRKKKQKEEELALIAQAEHLSKLAWAKEFLAQHGPKHNVVKDDNCYYCTVCYEAHGDGDGFVGKPCPGAPPAKAPTKASTEGT